MKKIYQPLIIVNYNYQSNQNPIKILQNIQEFQSYKLNNFNVINFNQNATSLHIDDVRRLIYQSQLLNNQINVKLIVIFHLDTASLEAQNALLKIIEEPPYNLKFIFFCSQQESIIPTLQSRCLIFKIPSLKLETPFLATNLPILYQKIKDKNYHLINFDDYLNIEKISFKEEKFVTLKILKEIILHLHQDLMNQKNNMDFLQTGYSILEKLVTYYHLINQNVNVKLALMSLFLALNSSSITKNVFKIKITN